MFSKAISHRSRIIRTSLVTLLLVLALLSACDISSDEDKKESNEEQHFTVGLVIPLDITLQIFDQYRIQMAALGYEEGRNITYIQKGPSINLRDMINYPKELADAKVDLIVVIATEGATFAQGATAEIPIVFIAGDTPIESGLVESLEHPGGNITGIMTTGPEARRLELLLEIVPTIKRLYVPYNPADMMASPSLDELQQAADALGVELVLREFEDQAALDAGLDDLPEDIDGIFILQDVLISNSMEQWAMTAVEHNLPLSAAGVGIEGSSGYRMAPLMGYGIYVPDIAQKAARLSDQILKGANPGDLPVETAEFYLMVNIDTANAIGVEVPDHILEQAQFISHWPEDGE